MTVAGLYGLFAFIPQVRAEQQASSSERLVTIFDRGAERTVLTRQTTLRAVLKEASIELDANDMVEPGLDEDLIARDYHVNIYRARPVIIVDGATKQLVMSAYKTPKQIAKHAGIELQDEDKTTLEPTRAFVRDGASVVMSVDRATKVNLVLYGKKQEVYTQATNVADFIKEKSITLASNDTLSVATNQEITANMTIQIWRNGKQTVTRDEAIAFPVEQIEDENRPAGYKKVTERGEKGKRTVSYEITMKNGKEVSRKIIQSVVIKKPTKQVEIIGTKNNYSGSRNEWLAALRGCEAGGNYKTNTGNGFYGAYQFMPATWNSIASKIGRPDLVGVLPSDASPADQDAMIIANTNMTAGLSTQNPGCYRSLGLSNKPPQ